jgi:uncharacterized protein (DUF58 family)
VAELATMELRARHVVEGAFSGRHRSAHQGQSLEFVGHRPYTPSDEWRHIDWKVFAKTDRWVVREQQEESNLRATLLLDSSRSMAFHSPGSLPKLRYASILSAALSYLLVHRHESVGLGLFNKGLHQYVPARAGAPHLSSVLDRLEKAEAGEPTDIRSSLEQAGQRLPRRSLVLILSDLLFPPEDLLHSVRTLLSRKHEIIVLQVLDPGERALSFEGDFVFEDMETGETVQAGVEEIRRRYRRLMEEHLEKIRRGLASVGVDFSLFETNQPLDAALSLFLERRLAQGSK